jgi:hypothetical protein
MPDVQAAWRFLESSDPVASAQEVQAAIRRLAGEIESALGERYPLVLAVMGGAVVFAGQILPLLRPCLALRRSDERLRDPVARASAGPRERARRACA